MTRALPVLLTLSAFPFMPQGPSGDEILAKVDRNMFSEQKIAVSRMIIHGRRETRTVESKSWQRGTNESYTEFLAPAREKGTKMLKLKDMLWEYSPSTDRTIMISGWARPHVRPWNVWPGFPYRLGRFCGCLWVCRRFRSSRAIPGCALPWMPLASRWNRSTGRSGSACGWAGTGQQLSAAVFYIVDVNVTLERWLTRLPDRSEPRSIHVREIQPAEYEAVLGIAATCFVYSRFHLDPLIPNDLANAIKRQWINSYCHHQRGEQLLIAARDDRPIGFLAVLATMVQGKVARVIDLIGVDKAHQGQGVGRDLVEFFIHDSVDRANLVRVGTQAANIPSIRLYETCGFKLAETTYVLHAHVRQGEVAR